MASFLLAAAILFAIGQSSIAVQFGGRSQAVPKASAGDHLKAAGRQPALAGAAANATVDSVAVRDADELGPESKSSTAAAAGPTTEPPAPADAPPQRPPTMVRRPDEDGPEWPPQTTESPSTPLPTPAGGRKEEEKEEADEGEEAGEAGAPAAPSAPAPEEAGGGGAGGAGAGGGPVQRRRDEDADEDEAAPTGETAESPAGGAEEARQAARGGQADIVSQTRSDPEGPAGAEEEEEVSVETGAEAEPAQAEEGTMEFPSDPGCYLRTPSGCPNHPTFSSKGWRHDSYAEKYMHAKENLSACEVVRKSRLTAYCGAADAETLFVPSIWGGQLGANETPVEPGCYVRTPSGCPNHPSFNSSIWRHEEYGEKSTTARVNRTACEVDRQGSVRHWCGADDAEMFFVPPPPPGCYVRTPSGCPNHPEYGSAEWKHEEFGENFTQAMENRTACEVDRRMHIAHWCGTISVHMLFVPAAQEDVPNGTEALRKDVVTPTEPGCFIRTPSGCPNHPDFGSDIWEHDRVGELSGARFNRVLCEGGRKEQISHWCGTEEVEVLFVPSPEPGCYVRTPSGCPSHPHYGGSNWTHDEFGEKNRTAGVHRIECEVARKEHVVHWCGTDDVQMSFVPPDWESLIVAGVKGGDGGPDGALEPPTQPGCYVRTPSGCPKHPSFESMQWKREEYGERKAKASMRRSVCEVTRRGHVAHWCGAEDVEMLFVPTPEPGCYVRTPSGCPKHPESASGTWRRDEDAENPEESQADRSVCEEARRADLAFRCGIEDVETLFIPAAAH